MTDHPTSADLAVLRALVAFLSGELVQADTYTISALRLDPDNNAAKSIRKRIKALVQLKMEGSGFLEEQMLTDAIGKYSEALQVRLITSSRDDDI